MFIPTAVGTVGRKDNKRKVRDDESSSSEKSWSSSCEEKVRDDESLSSEESLSSSCEEEEEQDE